AGRFQMTLHADFEPAPRIEAPRVHNCRADLFDARAGRDRPDMIAPRPVTALAVDAFGEPAAIPGLASRRILARRQLRITVMTKHASEPDLAAESHVLRLIVIRIHPPGAFHGVPAQWQLRQLTGWIEMQVRAGVVPRAHDV